MDYLKFLLVQILVANFCSAHPRNENEIKRAIKVLIGNSVESSCSHCADGKPEISVSEDAMRSLRIEFIKSQILKKLQLKQVPNIKMSTKMLPVAPISISAPKHTRSFKDNTEPDFFGTTNQIIVLGIPEVETECSPALHPSACFTFALPSSIDSDEMNSAELWVYKVEDFLDGDPNSIQTLTYHESIHHENSIQIEKHTTSVTEGWIKLNFTKRVKKWLDSKMLTQHLQVQCPSCGYRGHWRPISMEAGKQPVLVLSGESNVKKKRLKRNVNCQPGVTECCREKLYVSFQDIGWDDWIIQPKGYDAYFCTGSCSNAVSASLTASPYASMMRKLHSNTKRVELVPCCTATQQSPLQLLVALDNATVARNVLPNMVVETCGCM